MSTQKSIECDKCGDRIDYDGTKSFASSWGRLMLYNPNESRTYATQRIDLCPKCWEKFVDWLDQIQTKTRRKNGQEL